MANALQRRSMHSKMQILQSPWKVGTPVVIIKIMGLFQPYDDPTSLDKKVMQRPLFSRSNVAAMSPPSDTLCAVTCIPRLYCLALIISVQKQQAKYWPNSICEMY